MVGLLLMAFVLVVIFSMHKGAVKLEYVGVVPGQTNHMYGTLVEFKLRNESGRRMRTEEVVVLPSSHSLVRDVYPSSSVCEAKPVKSDDRVNVSVAYSKKLPLWGIEHGGDFTFYCRVNEAKGPWKLRMPCRLLAPKWTHFLPDSLFKESDLRMVESGVVEVLVAPPVVP